MAALNSINPHGQVVEIARVAETRGRARLGPLPWHFCTLFRREGATGHLHHLLFSITLQQHGELMLASSDKGKTFHRRVETGNTDIRVPDCNSGVSLDIFVPKSG